MATVQENPMFNNIEQKKKVNKYCYLHVVQGNYGYGHGWEDLCASEDRKEARADLKAYRENEPGTPHRIIRRRELNEQ